MEACYDIVPQISPHETQILHRLKPSYAGVTFEF